jgi:hypothetical protein
MWLPMVRQAMTQRTLDIVNARATDERTVAERRWRERTQARVAQAPCDIGLFSDDAKQAELFTTNRERK